VTQLAARFPVLLVPAGRPLLVREPDSGHSGCRRAVPAAATAEPTIRGGDAAWLRRSVCSLGARGGEVPQNWGCVAVSRIVVRWQHDGETSRVATELRNREKVKHSPWLSTALIDDLLDERFVANREQVTQPPPTDDPLRE
jgi:hypothetical protein